MSVISIYESEVSCLSSILDLQRLCNNEKVEFSPETNKFLLLDTLKKVGPSVAQKVVSKLVAQGEITWDNEEEFEVEQILDYAEEDDVEFYLIKWRGWSHAHNSWEPKDNIDCEDLMAEYHAKNKTGLVKTGVKRKFDEIKGVDDREQKRTRIDELFAKLITCKETMTPLKLISLTSPDKGKFKAYKGLVSCEGLKVPKFSNTGTQMLNPRTKAYKKKKIEITKALKDWEKHMNSVILDPAKITVENDVDLEGPPENFEYINDYKPGPGIEIPNEPIIGCECTECWSSKGECCPHQFGVEFAYYKPKRLKLPPGRPIYECNKRCSCGPECSNRVVQQGRKHRVCIFRTKNGRGWGVKALQRIKSGTFVMEYVGEVISSEEAEIRGQTYDAVGRTYLFDLDFNDGDCPFTVDAAVFGNVSHFVNHSCDPNLEVYSVWINTLDPRLPRIALFSRRDIEKGEELTFDYMSSKAHSPLEESVIVASSETVGEGSVEDPVKLDTAVDADKPEAAIDTNKPATVIESDVKESDVKESDVNVDTLPEGDKPTSGAEVLQNGLTHENSESNQNSDSKENLDSNEDLDSNENSNKVEDSNEKVVSDVSVVAVTAAGDADTNAVVKDTQVPVRSSPKKSPRKSPKVATDLYRMVCQCGAKNCRKFVF